MSKQAMEIIEQVANNLGEFAEAMETQHKADVLSQYASELFNCAVLLKEAIKQHDADQEIIDAARNLVAVKGRYHSEIAMERLIRACTASPQSTKGEQC